MNNNDFGTPLDNELEALIKSRFSNTEERTYNLNRIDVPAELAASPDYVGPIYGYTREKTCFHIILGWGNNQANDELEAYEIGSVGIEPDEGVYGYFEDDAIKFVWKHNGERIRLLKNIYEITQDAFSRNAGLLESGYLKDCCAIFPGVGSVGSTMSLMLARAGVGKFILIDPDILEIHNISRHQGDLSEVGQFKVELMAKRIKRINPNAEIKVFRSRVEDVDFSTLTDFIPKDKSAVFSGCDKMEGNACACDIAEELKIPFLSTAFFTMAWGLIMYYYVPQLGDIGYRTGMQEALLNERNREIAAIEAGNLAEVNHLYANSEDVIKYNFQPGVGADVEYGCAIAVKLALDLLNIENPDYIFRLLPYLHQYTQYVLNRNPQLGGGDNVARFADKPFQYWTIPVEGSAVYNMMVENAKKATEATEED